MKKIFFIMLVFLATVSYADNKFREALVNDSKKAIEILYNDVNRLYQQFIMMGY